MPRVKIDYIVSFSSEDNENQANNLLAVDVNKKKWLCKEGEPSCSVVLQLTKAVQIEEVNIGAYHAALVEVLVGLSEKPNDPYEVLVPSCVFVSAAESRRASPVDRVRSFRGPALAEARARRWDRVRIVCSQPYNKHCKYGLSFVHIYSAERAGEVRAAAPGAPAARSAPAAPGTPAAPTAPARLLAFDTCASDDDDFRPGELFARRHEQPAPAVTTDAQIRQASSQALKNLSDTSTKLMKTATPKPGGRKQEPGDERGAGGRKQEQGDGRGAGGRKQEQSDDRGAGGRKQEPGDDQGTDRRRDNLLYTDDDGRPHARIDRVLQAHSQRQSAGPSKRGRDDGPAREAKKGKLDSSVGRQRQKKKTDTTIDKRKEEEINVKKPPETRTRGESASEDIGSVLRGVRFSLSGYENPARARLRDTGLTLGAAYEPRDLARLTHLVCAFPNTPKMRELRTCNSAAVAVRGEWLEHCARAARRLSERAYAPGAAVPPAPDPPQSDQDTDDEIEKVLRRDEAQAKAQKNGVASTGAVAAAADSDFDSGGDTEPDEPPPAAPPQELQSVFDGDVVVLPAELPGRELLARHVCARGGLVLTPDEVDADTADRCAASPRRLWARLARAER